MFFSRLLREIVEEGDSLLTTLEPLLREATDIVQDVLRSPDQMAITAQLREDASGDGLDCRAV